MKRNHRKASNSLFSSPLLSFDARNLRNCGDNSINVEKVGSPKEAAAPSSASSVVLALPEAEAVKRVDDNLMEGGLL